MYIPYNSFKMSFRRLVLLSVLAHLVVTLNLQEWTFETLFAYCLFKIGKVNLCKIQQARESHFGILYVHQIEVIIQCLDYNWQCMTYKWNSLFLIWVLTNLWEKSWNEKPVQSGRIRWNCDLGFSSAKVSFYFQKKF